MYTEDEMNADIRNTHQDPRLDDPLGESPDVRPVKFPENYFDEGDITLREVEVIIEKARAKSAQGPSGLTYKIYKYLPRLCVQFWKLLNIIW